MQTTVVHMQATLWQNFFIFFRSLYFLILNYKKNEGAGSPLVASIDLAVNDKTKRRQSVKKETPASAFNQMSGENAENEVEQGIVADIYGW